MYIILGRNLLWEKQNLLLLEYYFNVSFSVEKYVKKKGKGHDKHFGTYKFKSRQD